MIFFWRTLPDNQKRAGYVEAIKVALIRDRAFFEWIEERSSGLARFEKKPMEQLIRRSAVISITLPDRAIHLREALLTA